MECIYFGICGSCRNYTGGYEAQLETKRDRITTMFAPFYDGGIDLFRSPEQHYRARAEFRVWHEGDASHYAMNRIDGKGVVPIESCPKVIEPIADMMPRLMRQIKTEVLETKLFGIDFLSTSDGEMVISMLYHRKLDDAWKRKAAAMAAELGISIIGRSRKQKVVIGRDHVTETLKIGGRQYRFEQIENSFTQPNPRVNEQMVGWALQHAEGVGGDLLELYCGAGNFTIPMATRFDKVLATEISKSSINAAKNNMKLNGVDNIAFVRMSAEEFVAALDGVRLFNRMKGIALEDYRLKTIFVDPPRAGMDAKSCAFVSRFDAVIYISCNPDTLKRDLEYLRNTHRVTAMALFDQFPYTDHLEMGVVLKKEHS